MHAILECARLGQGFFEDCGGARMSGGLVSVIVPTKNSAGTIEICVRLNRDLLIDRFDGDVGKSGKDKIGCAK